mgnify:FL=1
MAIKDLISWKYFLKCHLHHKCCILQSKRPPFGIRPQVARGCLRWLIDDTFMYIAEIDLIYLLCIMWWWFLMNAMAYMLSMFSKDSHCLLSMLWSIIWISVVTCWMRNANNKGDTALDIKYIGVEKHIQSVVRKHQPCQLSKQMSDQTFKSRWIVS